MPRTARRTASSSTNWSGWLAGRRELAPDQVEELLDRIDAERAGRDLITGLTRLPERDRAVIELVDIAGLRPKEAAAALGLTPGAVRMRLLRSRARLRGQAAPSAQASSRPAAGTNPTNQSRSDGHD
jgi:RNA polymerase sigma factor (sigma-70 family)